MAFEDMKTHDWIKECLRRRGTSFSALARQAGVSTSSIYSVSKGFARSARIEAMICATIGFTPSEIWSTRRERAPLTTSPRESTDARAEQETSAEAA